MKKYCVTFRWYKDYYNTELLMRRTYFIKANTIEESQYKAHIRLVKDFNDEESDNIPLIDEISIRDLTTKRKHIKKRYNLLYTM